MPPPSENDDAHDDVPDSTPEGAPTAALDAVPGPAASSGANLFSPGEVLAERFRIVAFLGRGGMGEVYEAEDLELHEPVALKTIRANLARDERFMERFKTEIQLARKVTHPNVCRIFDLERHSPGGQGGIAFLTMELLRGQTLAERLRQRGRMTAAEARPIAVQVAEALGAAHRAGVVHHDLKPANVMLVPGAQGQPLRAVVTDFGVARLVSEGAAPGLGRVLVAGTPGYLAPEVAQGREASPASDIYSLGVVLYEMLTGVPPRKPGTTFTRPFKRAASIPPPRTLVPDIDPAWEEAILRCLATSPRDRFTSALDVAGALTGRELAGSLLRDEGRPGRSWRLAIVVVLAAAVAAVAPLWLRPRGAPSPPPLRVASVQVTTSPGLDMYPAFSPDGESMAYASDRNGSFQIYVRVLGPVDRERPITHEGDNFEPAWSPDGRSIVYHAKAGGLWVVPSEGGTPKQITSFGSRPAWSPDGALIAFQSEPLVDLAANSFPALPPSTLWLVSRDGGTPRRLTKPGEPPGGHGAPSWSPDGRRIVFGAADRRLAEIWSVSVQGTGLERLVHDQPYAFDPIYAADGKSIYYSAFSRNFSIWAMRVSVRDGKPESNAVEVANPGSLRIRHLALSRDGRRIAYSALAFVGNLWWTPVSTGHEPAGSPRPVTSETGKMGRPSFSPDGKTLAFDRGRPGTSADIWVMDSDGTNLRPVTTDPAEENLPSWFPDGKRLAFLSNRNGRFAVRSHGLEDGVEASLLELDQDIDWARLSPDGRQVAFNSKKGGGTINTWLAAVAGGPPRQITFDKELMGFPCWSPDGSLLGLEVKRGEDTHIALMPSGGGVPVQLTSEAGQSWPYSFSPDGGWIAFAGQRGGVWNVWAVSRATREQRRLTNHAKLNAYVRTPAWSRNRIVYEYAETTGNIWMIENPR